MLGSRPRMRAAARNGGEHIAGGQKGAASQKRRSVERLFGEQDRQCGAYRRRQGGKLVIVYLSREADKEWCS